MSNINLTHFKFLPMSMRVLFSMVLLVFGLAYCMAMVQQAGIARGQGW